MEVGETGLMGKFGGRGGYSATKLLFLSKQVVKIRDSEKKKKKHNPVHSVTP